jgi:2'-5' RNA ligase
MRPPAAAQQIAERALGQLSGPERAAADLPCRIAAGTDLSFTEIAAIQGVMLLDDSSAEQRLARQLLGGEPMARAVAAAASVEQAVGQPDPGPHTGAMLAGVVPSDVAEQLSVSDGLPVGDLHVTLFFFGDAADLDESTRQSIRSVAQQFSARMPISVIAGHVGHLGDAERDGAVAVAYELTAPALHELHAEMQQQLDQLGVEYSDRFAFRPHLTITYLTPDEAESSWPEGPVDQPVEFELAGVAARFGDEDGDTDLIELQAPPTSPVTAAGAAVGYPVLSGALTELNGFLASVDRDLGVEVRTAVEIGWRSSLDRVGRMATRRAAAAAQRQLMQIEPGAAAVHAAADLSGLDVDALIGPAVDDIARHVERRAATVQAVVAGRIGELFGVDISNVWPEPAEIRTQLADAMTAELQRTLGRLGDRDRIDPTATEADPLLAPYQLTRNVLAFAGGADIVDGGIRRDGIGRPLTARLTAGADSVPLGPGTIELVRDALVSWSDAGVTAAARRRAGAAISDELRAELSEVASRMAGASEQPPLEQVTVHTWRLNLNGRAIENLPRHEKLAGTTVASVSDLQQLADAAADPNDWPGVSYSHPGDHRHCHCGWDTHIELRPVQLALPVS